MAADRLMPAIKGQEARDQYRFTCGDCHILAQRIARITGWTLATFCDGYGDPCLHAFVICPDGEALDIDGKRPLEQFKSDWSASKLSIATWTRASLRASTWWCPPTFGHYSYARARVVAGKVLDSIGWSA